MSLKSSVLKDTNGASSPDEDVETEDCCRQLTKEGPFLLDELPPPPRRGRPVCNRCCRPCRVCICSALPSEPILLESCHCVVLQHPKELERKNRSLSFLQLSLHPSSLTTVVSRRLDASTCPTHLAHLVDCNQEDESDISDQRDQREGHALDRPRCWLVFPHPDAIPLSQVLDEFERSACRGPPDGAPSSQDTGVFERDGMPVDRLILLFMDGTWRLAGEMYRSHEWPAVKFVRVKLGDDDLDTISGDCPCRYALRTPPSPRHLSTHECISYVLSKVEDRLCRQQLPVKRQEKHPALYHRLLVPMDLAVQQYKHFIMKNQKKKGDLSAEDRTASLRS